KELYCWGTGIEEMRLFKSCMLWWMVWLRLIKKCGGIGGDGVKDYSHLQYSGNGEVEGRSLVRMGAETRIDFIDWRVVMPIVTDVVDRRALMNVIDRRAL
nr:hypothetical protein [Tanacetum cinerariifolium]